MYADQLTAETRVLTEGRGRKVDEWVLPDKTKDNHFFDCTVGCHVSASMNGATMPEIQEVRPRRRKKAVRLSELQARKRGTLK
jgi:nitrous oxidase accessory protein NosD